MNVTTKVEPFLAIGLLMNTKQKIVKTLFPFFTLSFLVIGCDEQQNKRSSTNEALFKVGIITDNSLKWERGVSVGAKLFIDELYSKDECGISKVEFVFADSAKTPENSVVVVNDLIKNKDVDVIIGPNVSETAIPASEIAESYNTPMITLLSTNNSITKDKTFVYQMATPNKVQAKIITDFLNTQGNSTAVIYKKSDAYSRNFAEELNSSFEKLMTSNIEFHSFVNVDVELESIIKKLLARPPEYLVLPVITDDVIKIGKAVKDSGIHTQLIATDYLQVIEASKHEFLNGVLVFDHWHYSLNYNIDTYRFLIDYYKAKNEYTGISAAFVVDALQLVTDYLCHDKTPSGVEFTNFLNNLRNFKGVTGEIYLFKDNKAVRDFYLIQLDGDNTKVIKNLVQDK